MENEKSSKSNYKHKSGYTKRKLKLERELQAAKTNPKQSKLNFSSKISESFIKDNQYNEDKIETDQSSKKCIVSSNLHSNNGQDIINSPSNDVKLFSEQKTHILDNKLGLELFMAPSPKSTTQIKLTFLDQHPVHHTSDKNELPFQASRIYYRETATGDKFLRKWLSYCLNTNKLYCNICMSFSPDRDSVWVRGSSYTVKRIYDKIREHEEHCRSHEFAVQTFT